MAVAGLVVGICGTLVSVFALFFAALAARRADALLRRLVIYPYRELDISFAALTDAERNALLGLYACTARGKINIDPQVIAEVRTRVPELNPLMLGFLAERLWLQPGTGATYQLNRDRMPYLHFVREAEGLTVDATP